MSITGPVKSHPVVFGTILWLALGSVFALFFWELNSGDRSLGVALRDHGVTTVATVTGTAPSNRHPRFHGRRFA